MGESDKNEANEAFDFIVKEKQKILLTNHLIRNGFEFHIIFKLVNEYFIGIDEK